MTTLTQIMNCILHVCYTVKCEILNYFLKKKIGKKIMSRMTKYAHISRMSHMWDDSIKASNVDILTEIRVRP